MGMNNGSEHTCMITQHSLSQDGATALHVATHEGHLRVVQMLLEANADMNIYGKSELYIPTITLQLICTSMHEAAIFDRKPENLLTFRGLVQTIFGKISVIMTLTFYPPPSLLLTSLNFGKIHQWQVFE